MKISELIKVLEKKQEEHGDLECCTAKVHEYWGTVYCKIEQVTSDYIVGIDIEEHAQPEGPKSGKSEKCIVFKY